MEKFWREQKILQMRYPNLKRKLRGTQCDSPKSQARIRPVSRLFSDHSASGKRAWPTLTRSVSKDGLNLASSLTLRVSVGGLAPRHYCSAAITAITSSGMLKLA